MTEKKATFKRKRRYNRGLVLEAEPIFPRAGNKEVTTEDQSQRVMHISTSHSGPLRFPYTDNMSVRALGGENLPSMKQVISVIMSRKLLAFSYKYEYVTKTRMTEKQSLSQLNRPD